MALKGRQQKSGLRGALSKVSLPKPKSLPKPNLDGVSAKALGDAATHLAKGSEKLGELTDELKAARKAVKK